MPEKSVLSQDDYDSLLEVSAGFFHDNIAAGNAAQLLVLGLLYNVLGSSRLTTAPAASAPRQQAVFAAEGSSKWQ